MSQVDRLHFFSSLVWVIFFFAVWYCFIAGFCFPVYYQNLRGRYLLEKFIWTNINHDSYLLKLIVNFFDLFSIRSLKQFLIFNLVWKYRSYYVDQTINASAQSVQEKFADVLYIYNDVNRLPSISNKNKARFNDLNNYFKAQIRKKQRGYFNYKTTRKVFLRKSINNKVTTYKKISRW